MNPYDSPLSELPHSPDQQERTPSFAVRVSLCLAAAGFIATSVPIALMVLGDPSDEIVATDSFMSIAMLGGVTLNAVGMLVIFAAPPGRRALGFFLNAGVLAVLGALIAIGYALD